MLSSGRLLADMMMMMMINMKYLICSLIVLLLTPRAIRSAPSPIKKKKISLVGLKYED